MTNKMWGGRFQAGPDAIMEEINASIGFDKRLFRQDIAGSKAHAAMLAKQGIISKPDAALIRKGLDQVQAEIEAGTFTFSRHFDEARNPTVVYVRGEEMVDTPAGIFRTRVLDMHVRDPKRFQGAGVIRINLDMAGCHMPVRIMSKMPIIGTTTLTLTSVSSTATVAEHAPASCTL